MSILYQKPMRSQCIRRWIVIQSCTETLSALLNTSLSNDKFLFSVAYRFRCQNVITVVITKVIESGYRWSMPRLCTVQHSVHDMYEGIMLHVQLHLSSTTNTASQPHSLTASSYLQPQSIVGTQHTN